MKANLAIRVSREGSIMGFVLSVVLTIVLALVLNIVFRQSYNFIFFLGRRPYWWMLVVGLVGLGCMAIGSVFANGHNVAFWSAAIVALVNVPPRSDADEFTDVRHSKGKYRFGLAAFVLGCVVGYAVFFGEVCDASLQRCEGLISTLGRSLGF